MNVHRFPGPRRRRRRRPDARWLRWGGLLTWLVVALAGGILLPPLAGAFALAAVGAAAMAIALYSYHDDWQWEIGAWAMASIIAFTLWWGAALGVLTGAAGGDAGLRAGPVLTRLLSFSLSWGMATLATGFALAAAAIAWRRNEYDERAPRLAATVVLVLFALSWALGPLLLHDRFALPFG